MFTQCPGCKKVFTITAEQLRNDRAIMNCTNCNSQFDALNLLSDKRPNAKPGRYEMLEPDNKSDNQITPNNASLLQEMLEEQKQNSQIANSGQQPLLHHHATNPNSSTRKTPAFETIPLFEKKSASLYRDKELPPSSAKIWRYVVLALFVLLGIQIYHFEYNNLVQNKSVRPVLAKVCQFLHCQLPPYRNLSELAILYGSFKPISKNNYQLEAVFANQSSFPQAYPAIKLGLLRFNGEIIATRIFYPEEYLPENFEKTVIPGNEMVEISLEIVPPEAKIGGYTIDLL
jgi:predicted Zn finger-like uncharacterized protein